VSAASVYKANPRGLPGAAAVFCLVLVGLGVLSFAMGLARDPASAWRAFHINWLYYGAMAQGALALSCAFVIIGAKWAGPVRHVAEGLAVWVPITFLLGCVSYFGGEYVFVHWWHGAPHPKEAWLTPGRVYGTDLTILGVLAVLTIIYLKTSFRPALNGVQSAQAAGLFRSWTSGWRGDAEEWEASQKKLRILAPIIAMIFAFGYGMIGFDQVMSLTPTWFSNIFAWYFAWAGFLNGVAATALICVLIRNVPGWQAEITAARLHDLGKMVFAFSIFWMYLFFSQYIVIWYGNLPEETQFFQMRLGSQFIQDTWNWDPARLSEPWVMLSLTAWAGCWIIPFWVLLGQAGKKTPQVLGTVCAVSLLGFWLERNALVWPALSPTDDSVWHAGIPIGIALGFFGAFVLVQMLVHRVFPTHPLPARD
jgi:hypothetical protein